MGFSTGCAGHAQHTYNWPMRQTEMIVMCHGPCILKTD